MHLAPAALGFSTQVHKYVCPQNFCSYILHAYSSNGLNRTVDLQKFACRMQNTNRTTQNAKCRASELAVEFLSLPPQAR